MTVLMLGKQLELGHYRAEFLRSYGFHVIFPESKKDAIAAIRRGGFHTVIMSYTLSHETTAELVELIQQSCSDCPIIGLIHPRRPKELGFKADELVPSTDSPSALLEAIRRVERRLQESRPDIPIRQ